MEIDERQLRGICILQTIQQADGETDELVRTVADLIKAGADLSVLEQQGGGYHSLGEASFKGFPRVVRLLLDAEEGKQVDRRSRYGKTALQDAIAAGHYEIIQLLIDGYGANIALLNDIPQIVKTKLLHALGKHDAKVVKFLLDRGLQIVAFEIRGEKPLRFAVKFGYLGLVNALCDHYGYEILTDAAETHSRNLVHEAVRENHGDVARFLLKNGIPVEALDGDGRTALQIAVWRGYTSVVKILVEEFKANINVKEQKTRQSLLHQALKNGDSELAIYLIHSGISLSVLDSEGRTVLQTAVWEGMFNIVQLLVNKHGLSVDEVNPNTGYTLLHDAAFRGHGNILQFLAEKSPALVNKADNNGRTPLFVAILRKNLPIVKLLIENFNVDFNIFETVTGETLLHLAAFLGEPEIVNYLVKKGAQVGKKERRYGESALEFAVYSGRYEAAEILLNSGANFKEQRPDGSSLVQFAKQRGHGRIANLLRTKGAC